MPHTSEAMTMRISRCRSLSSRHYRASLLQSHSTTGHLLVIQVWGRRSICPAAGRATHRQRPNAIGLPGEVREEKKIDVNSTPNRTASTNVREERRVGYSTGEGNAEGGNMSALATRQASRLGKDFCRRARTEPHHRIVRCLSLLTGS